MTFSRFKSTIPHGHQSYYPTIPVADYLRSPSFGYPQDFPVWAIPFSCQAIVEETAKKYNAPPEMVFASFMAAISLATQSSYKLRRYNGMITLVTLWMLVVADSGLHKTSVDRHFMSIFDEIKNTIDKAAILNESSQDKELKKTLKSIRRRFKYSNATPEAVAVGLSQWASAALISNDAGGILNSRTTSDLEMFNTFWDDQPYEVDRIGRDSFSLENVYLTLLLMVQPQTFQKFLSKNGQHSRDNGFSARGLHAIIDKNRYIGYRFEDPYSIDNNVNLPEHAKFKSRIWELAQQSLTPEQLLINKPIVLDFDIQANRACVDFYNAIEYATQFGQPLNDIHEAASKALDNMCRIAALFHIYDGAQGQITESTVWRASEVMLWYLNSYKCLYSQRVIQQSIPLDFQILENWLINYLHKNPSNFTILRNWMRKSCPNILRQNKRFDHALNNLIAQNKVLLGLAGKTTYVNLNRDYFQQRLQNQGVLANVQTAPYALEYT
ncbi:MAG: hypothetical protein RLY95_1136 [Pseudomonadota bacterium]|jgi:hypothetical protein